MQIESVLLNEYLACSSEAICLKKIWLLSFHWSLSTHIIACEWSFSFYLKLILRHLLVLLILHQRINRAILFCGNTVLFFYCRINSFRISIYFKFKFRTLTNFRFDTDFTSQLLNNELWYRETETHTSLIDFLGLMKFPKKLKQPLNSIGLYTNSSISHSCNKTFLLIFKRHSNASLKSKLGSIAY